MNNDKRTTRELAEIWWNELPDFTKDELNVKYWFDTIETIYLSEHPEQSLPSKNIDDLEDDIYSRHPKPIKEQSSNRGEGDSDEINITELFKEWLSEQDIKKVNKEATSTLFNSFVKKLLRDKYSEVSLIINQFEKQITN